MTMRKPSFSLACLPLALAACSTPSEPTASPLDTELSELIAMLPGEYAGDAPKGMQPDGEMHRLVHAFMPAEAAQFGEQILYYHIAHGEPDGPVLQAKIFVFDTDQDRPANTMKAYVLAPEVAETLRKGDAGAWAALDPAGLMSFPDTCYFMWERYGEGFKAEDADTCSYPSAVFKQTITPDMTYRISPKEFSVDETLLGEDGTAIVTTGGPLIAERIGE
ncbi:hypothetical protein [Altererythrobacter sp. GH1-8]|uniref:hypothetical protein n=1 Tax=Altererythrobacter sp. GH1-8 TaxID=3349333 RepID=UPI00374D9369